MNFRLRRFGLMLLLLVLLFPLLVSVSNASFRTPKLVSLPKHPSTPNMGDPFPQPPLREMGTYGRQISAFAAHGDYAYAIEGDRIRVLSYADPANVTVISEIFSFNPFFRVQLSEDGTRLFALTGYSSYRFMNELIMYDVSDPTQPRMLANRRGAISEMHSYQNRLYIIVTEGEIVDVETQLQVLSWEGDRLTVLGKTRFQGYGEFFFDGDVLVVAPFYPSDSHYRVYLYDISDDTAPTLEQDILTIGGVAIAVNGYLYVSNQRYVDIWDIRDLPNALIVQTIPNFSLIPLAKQGHLLLTQGGKFYDLSDPLVPHLVGEMEGFNFFALIWDEEDTFYAQQPQEGLYQVHVTDNFEAIPLGKYAPTFQYAAVPVTERYLYLFGTTSPGIDIHDMQDPHQPRLVNTVFREEFTWPPTRDYYIVDQRLYLLASSNIVVLDISDPLAPSMVATLPLPPATSWLLESVQNGYLYALERNTNQIYVLRLSDLMGQLSSLPNADSCKGLDVEGTLLVAACDALRLYDISNPTAPNLVGSLPTALSLLEPTLALPYLFVTTKSQLAIYEMSNPAAPQYVTSVAGPYPTATEDGVTSFDSSGEYLCPELIALDPGYYLRQCYYDQGWPVPTYGVADIVDLRTPATPRRSESVDTFTARGVVQGDTLVITKELFSVWQIRPFLEQAVFVPVVQTGN